MPRLPDGSSTCPSQTAELTFRQVAADLSHINTAAQVAGYLPKDDGVTKALKGSKLVIIPAGVPRKPGMT